MDKKLSEEFNDLTDKVVNEDGVVVGVTMRYSAYTRLNKRLDEIEEKANKASNERTNRRLLCLVACTQCLNLFALLLMLNKLITLSLI